MPHTGFEPVVSALRVALTAAHGKQPQNTGLQTLMRRILAQINVRAATHIFRHTFANEYVRADGSLEKLRRILGHVSLETTQQYVHLLPADLLAHRTDVDPLDAPLFYFHK